ncbi:twin-arginine translocation signal domain-containing protein [Natrinema sp. 74]|uniref:twin-arginine translocation signal domain-containing protein n=1 Tax=Natrinema sp. 74 TaxID=3384159 RepID=UPI0038D4E3EB
MTDNDTSLLDRIADDESRRSFLKKSALTTAVTGLAASGTVAAQEDEGGVVEADDEDPFEGEDQIRVAAFQDAFQPNARFMIVSGTIEYAPNVPENLGGPLTGFNAHMAAYVNTGKRFTLFVQQGENLGASFNEDAGWFVDNDEGGDGGGDGGGFNQPALYEFESEFSRYEGTDRIVTTYALPLEQDVEEQVFAAQGINDEEDVNDFLF